MNRAGSFCVCVTVTLFLSLLADAQVATLVLEGGTLIDGKGGSPINDAVVVVEGSRIKSSATCRKSPCRMASRSNWSSM